jgi:hypothetical protein
MRRVLAVVAALSSLAVSDVASAYCLMTTSKTAPTEEDPCPDDGIPIAWRQRCLGLALDEGGARDIAMDVVRAAVTRSFERWTAVECDGLDRGFVFRVEPELAQCPRAYFDFRGANANTLAFVADFEELGYDPTAFAVTIVWHSTSSGEIYDADLLVNERFSPYVICPDGGCTQPNHIDLENVITHEAGHFFGLAHSEVLAATMYARAPRGEVSKRTLETDDVLGFCAAYPDPLTDECDFTPHGGFDPSCPDEGDDSSGRRGCGCDAGAAPDAGLALACVMIYALVRTRRRRA